MILNRLYELALRESLLDDPAFEWLPVPFLLKVGDGGKFLAFEDHHGTVTLPAKKKDGADKQVPGKGIPTPTPRPHGNTASQGFARYFVDTLPRVLPVTADEKSARSRKTFWEQIDRAADATDDPALRAVQAFGRSLADPAVAAEVTAAVAVKEPADGERVTFSYAGDQDQLVVRRAAVRGWYSGFFTALSGEKQAAGPVGFCTITGTVGPLPTSHAGSLSGVPGGLPTGVKLVSFDKPAFQHYGLDGAANAAIGYTAADGYARAFQHLRATKGHHVVIGGTLFLFWTRVKADLGWMAVLTEATASDVEKLLTDLHAGKSDAVVAPNDFYLLTVTGNAARAVVRDYLERSLGEVRANIARWFADLRIADPSREHQGRSHAAFPLWLLAVTTALESDRVAPDTHARLTHAALTGGPLPDSVLAACLGRLRAEGGDGFRAARMALVKLCLNRHPTPGGRPVADTLDPDERHEAYVYGRFLSVFEQIQYAALGDVNASVVDKFYGTMSAAPASVFGRLAANAQNHLRKLHGDKPGTAVNLEKRLLEVRGLLGAAPPPARLSLQDQGRFALGYYFEKAKGFEDIAARKLAKDVAAAEKAAAKS